MSVTHVTSCAGWADLASSGPARPPAEPSDGTAPNATVLTVTVSIPISDDEESLTAPARRLLEAARELVERGEAMVSLPNRAEPNRAEPNRAEPNRAEPNRAEPNWADVPPRTVGRDDPPAGLHVMAASRTVLLDGEPLPLTRLEYDLLLHFVENPRRVFTRLQLLAAVWGYEHTGARTVDVHIRRLRVKVGDRSPLITTVYGVGYRLADDVRITIDAMS